MSSGTLEFLLDSLARNLSSIQALSQDPVASDHDSLLLHSSPMALARAGAAKSRVPKSTRRQLDDKSKENKSMMSAATNGGTTDRVRRLPNYVQVADAYIFQQTIDERLKRVGVTQAREDSMRIAGVQYIDQVRRALKLPVRTFNTACMYFHKFRLVHSDSEYSYMDAAAASLFTACKIEDTLKKSRDILCAAHNLKIARPDQLSPDDPIFEPASRTIIGLERLMLEAAGFDFRSRHPQALVVNLLKRFGYERESPIARLAYKISIDLYRTFAPLKQTTAALAFACVELAERIQGSWNSTQAVAVEKEYARWGINQAMVMESLLDLLDLYTTNFRSHTALSHISLDTFLVVRIPLNSECDRHCIPRYTEYIEAQPQPTPYAGGRPTNGARPNGIHPGKPQQQQQQQHYHQQNQQHQYQSQYQQQQQLRQQPHGRYSSTYGVRSGPRGSATSTTTITTSTAAAAVAAAEAGSQHTSPHNTHLMTSPSTNSSGAPGSGSTNATSITNAAAAAAAAAASHSHSHITATGGGASATSQGGIRQRLGERGRDGTVRFLLDPERESEEARIRAQYALSEGV
ncbi:hypothetical protein DV736_g3000, partial [Chaetothyriales sp. CBS 134916]